MMISAVYEVREKEAGLQHGMSNSGDTVDYEITDRQLVSSHDNHDQRDFHESDSAGCGDEVGNNDANDADSSDVDDDNDDNFEPLPLRFFSKLLSRLHTLTTRIFLKGKICQCCIVLIKLFHRLSSRLRKIPIPRSHHSPILSPWMLNTWRLDPGAFHPAGLHHNFTTMHTSLFVKETRDTQACVMCFHSEPTTHKCVVGLWWKSAEFLLLHERTRFSIIYIHKKRCGCSLTNNRDIGVKDSHGFALKKHVMGLLLPHI